MINQDWCFGKALSCHSILQAEQDLFDPTPPRDAELATSYNNPCDEILQQSCDNFLQQYFAMKGGLSAAEILQRTLRRVPLGALAGQRVAPDQVLGDACGGNPTAPCNKSQYCPESLAANKICLAGSFAIVRYGTGSS